MPSVTTISEETSSYSITGSYWCTLHRKLLSLQARIAAAISNSNLRFLRTKDDSGLIANPISNPLTMPLPNIIRWMFPGRRPTSSPPSSAGDVERQSHSHGSAPLASLYRMHEYIFHGHTLGLRSEIEFFFNNHDWKVSEIPNPADPDPRPSLSLVQMAQSPMMLVQVLSSKKRIYLWGTLLSSLFN